LPPVLPPSRATHAGPSRCNVRRARSEKTSIMFSRIPSALALAVILLCASCQHHEHEAKAKPKYLVTTPLRQTTELTKEYVAQVRAIQHIELCALEGGYLQDVFVDEGQKVEKGQRMFQIMPLIYQAEVQKAQAEAELS